MDRLEPLDALFVEAEDEDENTSMAIASIAVLEGPAPSQQEVLALVQSRLPLVPRYRQKLRTVPFRLGRPVWVDDPDFDLSYHVRRTALPEPGGDQQLAALMARVMSRRLDRDHPLWEYWVVEGLARDRWALISKVHHCMVDGIGGADLYRLLTEVSQEPDQPPADLADKEAAQPPSAVALVAHAAVDMTLLPLRQARVLGGAVADPGGAIRQAADVARALARLSPSLWPAGRRRSAGTSARSGGTPGHGRLWMTSRRSSANSAARSTMSCWPRSAAVSVRSWWSGASRWSRTRFRRWSRFPSGRRMTRAASGTRFPRPWPIFPCRSTTRWNGWPPSGPNSIPSRRATRRSSARHSPPWAATARTCWPPGWSGGLSRCHSGKSSRSRRTCLVPASRSTGWDAASRRSFPMSRSRARSAPGSRSSATTAASCSASPPITPRTRMWTSWPVALSTAYPSCC